LLVCSFRCSFVSFDSLAFLLDDTTTGQLVFAFASEMYDTAVYVFLNLVNDIFRLTSGICLLKLG
jgi:hypothetical protein